jgi:lipopolysaccharide/colanic/teichoic acid biosynthesis glycosyltransferase
MSPLQAFVKRTCDLAICSVALLVVLPFGLAIAAVITLDSPGPVFYRGRRIGRGMRPFHIFKFRTMVPEAEQIGGPSTAHRDPRLTRVGAVLRRYKLDELPQLLNILSGDMSIVGPRPQVEVYTSRYSAREREILSVRPGLTDYASIRFINLDEMLGDDDVDGRYQREIEPEKNRLRTRYVDEQSLLVVLKIVALTVLALARLYRMEPSAPLRPTHSQWPS